MDYKLKIKKVLIAFFLLAVPYAFSYAETLTKMTLVNGGSSESFGMHNNGKMYFSGNYLMIDTLGNGTVQRRIFAEVDKILFSLVDVSNTGVETVLSSSPSLAVYPNPVLNEFSIKSDADGVFEYSILSVSGETVAQSKTSNGATVDVSGLKSGLYFVRVGDSYLKFTKR